MSRPSHSTHSSLFPATMWSAVAGAREEDEAAALAALERLALAYWRPLYVFVRQRGTPHAEAADEVQGFFAHLLRKEALRRVERRETRFRTFLLRCFQNWRSTERAAAATAKRGGGRAFVPLQDVDEAAALPPSVEGDSPERAYDRRWARELYEQAIRRLDEELAGKDRAELLLEVRRRSIGAASPPAWQEVARDFALSENAVKQVAHSTRARFAEILKLEVLSVVGSEADLAEEMRYLVQLLSGRGA